MSGIICFGVVLGLLACQPAAPPQQDTETSWMTLEGRAQGTTFRIVYKDSLTRNFAVAVDSLFRVIDLSMSTYVDSSVISRVNRGEQPVLDAHFVVVTEASRDIHARTSGAFDPTVKPLVDYWGFGGEKYTEPELVDTAVVAALLQRVGMDRFTLTDAWKGEFSADTTHGLTQLDFNAIAQGYSVDVIAAFLEARGIHRYLIEVGGEVLASGLNTRDTWWVIGIDKPLEEAAQRELQAKVSLRNQALATSGGYRKFYVKDGVKYSHSIDARTGFPVDHNLLSVTVLADRCATADAYATAFLVMGTERTKAFLKEYPELGLEVYLISDDGAGGYEEFVTDSLQAILTRPANS